MVGRAWQGYSPRQAASLPPFVDTDIDGGVPFHQSILLIVSFCLRVSRLSLSFAVANSFVSVFR